MYKYEELIKMSAEQLIAILGELKAKSEVAKGEELDKILDTATMIDGILKDAKSRAELAKIAQSAAPRTGEGETAEQANGEMKAREERGAKLKSGSAVKYKGRFGRRVNDTLSVTQTVTPVHTASDVRETFNDVSSLIDRVRIVPLIGGETYQRGYVKSYGNGGGATAEGANYSDNEPTFGYVTIEKQKVTAYTEEPNEMIKLPNADYDGVVEASVTRAVRRYITRQILVGDGSTAKFKGIFHNPQQASEQVINPSTDITSITEIDADTLDDIIYEYGGDEEVEDVAVLILCKKDLKAFAKVKDKQGRKVYTIINHGNTGTIDGVPYLINSACVSVADATAGQYEMAYGPLSNYEMAIFSDIETQKSTDFKFKTGQVAYRAEIFAGGAVAAYNGFIRVKKAAGN